MMGSETRWRNRDEVETNDEVGNGIGIGQITNSL